MTFCTTFWVLNMSTLDCFDLFGGRFCKTSKNGLIRGTRVVVIIVRLYMGDIAHLMFFLWWLFSRIFFDSVHRRFFDITLLFDFTTFNFSFEVYAWVIWIFRLIFLLRLIYHCFTALLLLLTDFSMTILFCRCFFLFFQIAFFWSFSLILVACKKHLAILLLIIIFAIRLLVVISDTIVVLIRPSVLFIGFREILSSFSILAVVPIASPIPRSFIVAYIAIPITVLLMISLPSVPLPSPVPLPTITCSIPTSRIIVTIITWGPAHELLISVWSRSESVS